ncbi:AEC family transporter [Haloferax sp. AB510]|uniref:AEC family transporter n=1 Tax=Haloferax sp. AB510 TaxID=2934172 RepID=UPI00209BFB6F|nr:AEC family transporter [Haloferax sp. AB510]MCO8266703.1 AEC family transporter [Haloferax sp. AB510]
MSLTGAFTNAILPILGVSVVGYLLARTTDIDVGPINTLGLYVLIPALAFHSIATTTLDGGEVLKLGVGVVSYALLMIAIAWGVGRLAGESGPLLGALMLAAAFPNSGFVGIPLSGFAFGEVGRTTAVIYLTIQNLVVYTLGVYIASNGTDNGVLDAVTEIFRLPLLYAIIAGVIARALNLVPPVDSALMETVGLVGDASIPVMLLILGIQLAETNVSVISRSLAPTALKLVVAPLVGFGLALALGFGDPTVAKVFVLECATPAAVIPLALTIEYADETAVDGITAPEYLSTTIFTTTVASVGVLTVLVAVLQAGALF